MDILQASSSENNPNQILKSNECEPTHFRNSFHSVKILEDLQSLRKNEVLCDIRFKTDDGTIVLGHKNVLMAASPYFRAMFDNFYENNKDLVNIRELDSLVLQILVEYIYTGDILVTKENVQVLLPAANLLQLDYVNSVCAEFLQKQLNPSNCLGIRAFADLHNCTDLLSISEAYIKQHFLEVAKGEDFLSLSSEDLVKLISSNDLTVPFEEKVFECVIKWVKHDLDQRKDFLPELMEHVRLPLLRSDTLNNVVEEPLLYNSPKCNNFIIEALHFNLQKSVQHFTIPKTIRCKPRHFGGSQKVILIFNWSGTSPKCYTEWYDPATKLREKAPGLNDDRVLAGFGVIRDQFVFAIGGVNMSSSKSVSMLDVSSQSPSWVPMADMLVSRKLLGVGILNDQIYAIGGCDGNSALKSVEVFNVSTQKWRMVSSMTIERRKFGVGVLNNCLYAVGGYNGERSLKSVEYYDPTLDIWAPVAEMSECDMNLGRFYPGVVALNGLLYVFGGESESIINTVEIYNPNTNTWTLEKLSGNEVRIYGGVVVDRPHYFH